MRVRVHVWRPNSENGRLKLAMLGGRGLLLYGPQNTILCKQDKGWGGGGRKEKGGVILTINEPVV